MRFKSMIAEGITPTQKKIIIIGLIVLFSLFFFWFFIYLPKKNTVTRIKSELEVVQRQIRQIEGMANKGKTISENIRLLKEKQTHLTDKFPQKEEESLKIISAVARRLNIEVLSIKPSSKEAFIDENKKEVRIGGRLCQKIFISMGMRCTYEQLTNYLKVLKTESPAAITIERLEINKKKVEGKNLNIVLQFYFYLLA